MFEEICLIYGKSMVSLFSMYRKHKSQMYISSVPVPLVWKDAYQHPWYHLNFCVILPFTLRCQIISQLMIASSLSVFIMTPLWPHQLWFLDLLFILVDEPLWLPMVWNLLVQLHVRKFHQCPNTGFTPGIYLGTHQKGRHFGISCERDHN